MSYSRTLKGMAGFALVMSIAAPAAAGRDADLSVSISGAANMDINSSGQFNVVARNDGRRRANNVLLDVIIPGNLSIDSYSNACAASASGLQCSLGRIKPGHSHTVSVNLQAGATEGAATIVASGNTSSRESNFANNSATHVVTIVDPTPPPPPPPASFPINQQTDLYMEMCVSLSAPLVWADCTPGSLLSHTATLNTNNSIETYDPGVWGTWNQVNDTVIEMNFFSTLDNSPMSTMSGTAVSATCFEGTTVYHQNTGYGAWRGCKP